MWNAGVPPPMGSDPRDNMAYYGSEFGHSTANYDTNYAYDMSYTNTTQHDPSSMPSSYAQSSTAPSEYMMSAARRPHKAMLSQHNSAPVVPRARRQSMQSVAASNQRPTSVYAESAYFTSSSAMSPTLSIMAPSYYPNQDSYSPHDFLDFTGYEISDSSNISYQMVSDSSISNSIGPSSPGAGSDEETSASDLVGDAAPRSHPLYHALPSEDGYYHCPFVATENCGHEPKQLKCEYDKHIDSHLKPFRCKSPKCGDLHFSSTACLLRHEREAHDMHGHEESLCDYPPCNRSMAGNGFRRSYNCKDHMTRCHGWVDAGPPEKKRRSTHSAGAGKVSGVSKTKSKPSKKQQQLAKLRQEWVDRKTHMESLTRSLPAEGPLMSIQLAQIQAEVQTLEAINAEMAKLTRKGTSG